MGNTNTTYERKREGYKMKIEQSPSSTHTTEHDDGFCCRGASAQLIDSSMSLVRVSTKDANKLQSVLEREYFSNWKENCDIREFYGYTESRMDTLLKKIRDSFPINGVNIYDKMRAIRFSEDVGSKIVNFSFGDELTSGVVLIGMVAISKRNDRYDAVSCLYTLNFSIGRTLVEKTDIKTILGIPYSKETNSWYENKSLGFITQKALVNFCTVKALHGFKRHNMVSRINDVLLLDNI